MFSGNERYQAEGGFDIEDGQARDKPKPCSSCRKSLACQQVKQDTGSTVDRRQRSG